MKKVFLLAAFGLSMAACSPVAYQVMETKSESLPIQNGKPTYENNELQVSYNFWNNDQAITFEFYNKSDKPIYLDLTRSHLIINGQSFDYFQEQEKLSTVTAGKSAYAFGSIYNQQIQNTTSSRMKRIIEIPPRSFTSVYGLPIFSGRFADCDLRKVKRQAVSKNFTQEDSPINFRNYLTYSLDPELTNSKSLDNSFFVEKISIMSAMTFQGKTSLIKRCPTDINKYSYLEMPYKKPTNIFYKYIIR